MTEEEKAAELEQLIHELEARWRSEVAAPEAGEHEADRRCPHPQLESWHDVTSDGTLHYRCLGCGKHLKIAWPIAISALMTRLEATFGTRWQSQAVKAGRPEQ